MEYNPFSQQCVHNPFPVYRYLRDEAPVYHNPALGFYALSRFEDVLHGLLDTTTYKSSHGVTLEGIDVGQDLMMNKDDPQHLIQRRIVSRAFTPKSIATLEPQIRTVAGELLDGLRDRDHFDVVAEYSLQMPMAIISAMLGLPMAVRARVQALSARSTAAVEMTENPQASDDALAAMIEMHGVLSEVVAQAAKDPGDNVLGMLLRSKAPDAAGNPFGLTPEQVVTRVIELASAGHETVAKQIGNAVVALNWYPEQRAELVKDPELMRNAVEEMLRWDPASHYVVRFIEKPVTLHGTTIPENSRVVLLTAAANHDERVFADPELFDIHRKIERHVGFAFGTHLCLGAALARLETRVACQEFLARYPHYDLGGPIVRYYSGNIRGLSNLPVLVNQAA